jgi:hypothetical protein
MIARVQRARAGVEHAYAGRCLRTCRAPAAATRDRRQTDHLPNGSPPPSQRPSAVMLAMRRAPWTAPMRADADPRLRRRSYPRQPVPSRRQSASVVRGILPAPSRSFPRGLPVRDVLGTRTARAPPGMNDYTATTDRAGRAEVWGSSLSPSLPRRGRRGRVSIRSASSLVFLCTMARLYALRDEEAAEDVHRRQELSAPNPSRFREPGFPRKSPLPKNGPSSARPAYSIHRRGSRLVRLIRRPCAAPAVTPHTTVIADEDRQRRRSKSGRRTDQSLVPSYPP